VNNELSKGNNANHNLEGTNSLIWMLLYLGISILLAVLLPFPIAPLALLVVLFSLQYSIRLVNMHEVKRKNTFRQYLVFGLL
jgi:hypothetical protein